MFRKTIFWIHLCCGVAAAIVIVMMSFTGVVLTYERQMIAWAERGYHSEPADGAKRLSIEEIITRAGAYVPQGSPGAVTIENDSTAPVAVSLGRGRSVYVNAYTGRVLGEGAEGLKRFFSTITGWHRWFDLEGDARSTGRAITGASNLVFLFLVISGMYLWLPSVFRWPAFRGVLLFQSGLGSKARDFNWHHVFGIWSAIPLAVVIATASVFYYPWANNLVYQVVGEEPPARGIGMGGGMGGGMGAGAQRGAPPAASESLSVDDLFSRAADHLDDWNTISASLPGNTRTPVTFTLDQGNGGQPTRRHSLTLSQQTGEVVNWAPFDSQNPGRKLRVYIRFLHTGEALGIVGQTIAGLVSLFSLIMVWTGLALAWRRLIQPLFRKRPIPNAVKVK